MDKRDIYKLLTFRFFIKKRKDLYNSCIVGTGTKWSL
jgi:hypothetical protein